MPVLTTSALAQEPEKLNISSHFRLGPEAAITTSVCDALSLVRSMLEFCHG